jgi:hypothetical protein
MDMIVQELASRMEAVMLLARHRACNEPIPIRRSQYEAIASNFKGYIASLVAGHLPPIGTGTGLGATRTLSEWDLQDEGIENAIHEIERLYRTGL